MIVIINIYYFPKQHSSDRLSNFYEVIFLFVIKWNFKYYSALRKPYYTVPLYVHFTTFYSNLPLCKLQEVHKSQPPQPVNTKPAYLRHLLGLCWRWVWRWSRVCPLSHSRSPCLACIPPERPVASEAYHAQDSCD